MGLWSKSTPLDVMRTVGWEEVDGHGRVVTLEFDKFYVLSVYYPALPPSEFEQRITFGNIMKEYY